ncbi:extracellular matrix-binding protein ebh [Eurosta solidaginis]|uniref:extracellular matrix-binding protein ebh n=1 Tax=Eurosta solidaginis TaxID=178769 RepID=UPI003530C2B4
MQQQQRKRQHRSISRFRVSSISGGGGGGNTRSASALSGRRPLSVHHDYTSTTNHSQQQPKCGGAIAKTFKSSATGEESGRINTKYSGNRHLNKNKNNNTTNNNNASVTATEAAATELQYKRQRSPEYCYRTINVSADKADFDISNIALLNNSQPTYAEPVHEDVDVITNVKELRTLLNESQTTTNPISNTLVKLHTKSNNNSLIPLNLLSLAASLPTIQTSVRPTIATAYATTPVINSNQFDGGYINVESLLLQRLQAIKYYLRLTAASAGGELYQQTQRTTQSVEVTSSSTVINNLATQGIFTKSEMVHENKPESMERDVVVNSTSLEDVAHSELSDNRAQSIQSLHSVETPTPDDSTPSFDELQQRLETSNRNIQNMQEQQQQLLRLQNAAKQHLSEMEHLRQQAGTLSFGGGNGCSNQAVSGTTDGAPEYESIEQVHSDMATLVGRMKNLTTFIQNQNELSSLLGDDGPEILAEQEALQRKLESLRAQRDDMRTLVNELQSINRTAERRVADGSSGVNATNENEELAQATVATDLIPKESLKSQNMNGERVVPVTYTRNVPIKLANGGVAQPMRSTRNKKNDNVDPEEKAATALLIQQKVADIETMRKQLRRLKEMMDTVNMIDAQTSHDANDVGRDMRSQSRSTNSSAASFDRECTPVSVVRAHNVRGQANNGDNGGVGVEDDAYLTRKMRMINEVTSDLRAQAESLQAERDRIKALKEEIIMRKQQAADAAQLGEDALKRSSLTPTPTPRSHKQRELDTPSPPSAQCTTSQHNDPLKLEYEAKKREFEILCHRLQQQDEKALPTHTNTNTSTATGTSSNNKGPHGRDTVSEADDEADGDEELIDSDFPTSNATSTARQYFTAPQQQSTPAQQHRAAVKAAVTAHTLATGTATSKVNVNPPHNSHQNQSQRLSKEDSFETNITTSSAGERRHSTLANATNTTHDGASIEAGSMQSGSSAFSMPPPMPAMGACSSWPPMPPLPNTWNPQFYYGFGASAPPPHPPSATQPNSATTTHSAGAPFTPVGLLSQSAANSDCICSGGNSVTNAPIVTGGPTPLSGSTNTAAQLAADPVLLHQFVQTQQMLINSVCQCNQMLWHQQREIDALNQTIHVLQERLQALTSNGINSVQLNDLPFSIRAESVPPPTLSASSLPNNSYLSSKNRAQSEQPIALFLPSMTAATNTAARYSAFTNYQHHHQQQQQQYQQRQTRRHISSVNGGAGTANNSYNFSTETQHSNIATASSTNAGLYSTLNNAAVQPPPPPPSNQVPTASHYNNEIPQSPPLHGAGNAAGPGPIFMHHHNNAIHQNNANLRTQNHYANNLLHQQQQLPPQQQQQHGHSNVNIGGNTLNNQVPPGNRANNYWDNFRSYSRQNLLSTNSNKSNEEQQHQQQSQHQHYLQQRAVEQLEPPGVAHYRAPTQPHARATAVLPTAAALTTSNLQQLQRQQQQEQQQEVAQQQQRSTQTQPQLQQMHGLIGEDNNSNSCNNLNYERNGSNNKHLRTLQRSHINRYQQQNLSYSNSTFTDNHNNLYQSWLPHADDDATNNAGAVANNGDDGDENVELDAYDAYNIIDSDLAVSPYAHLSSNICANSSNMLRNMNVNYGNSPHYQRNKLLAKPNCRGNADGAMEQHNLNRARHQQQQQQQQRLLTQQHLALRAQQQLDQSTLRPIPNRPGYKPACYLDLLPATVSEAVATGEARLRNRERVDMLLRTVTTATHDDGDDDAVQAALATNADGSGRSNFNSPDMPPNANSALLLDSNEIGNNTPNIDNVNPALNGDGVEILPENDDAEEEEDDEDEEDTTSEEIKRNLLVNALKNDKFTTKFYESIKEDVFRRLERILLERESAEGNCQGGGATAQNCNRLANATNSITSINSIDICNDVLSAAAIERDPTRKFNLNARMGNQLQQQRLQQYQQQQRQLQQQRQQQQQKYQQHHASVSPSAQHVAAAQAVLANCYQIRQEVANEQAAEDDQHVLPPSAAFVANGNNIIQAAGVDENAEEDEFSANNADTESNKADNEDAAAALNFSHTERMPDLVQTRESEQPEEDNASSYSNNHSNCNNNVHNNVPAGDPTIVSVSNAGRAEGNIASWRKNMLNHVDCNAERMSTATNNDLKRKNQPLSTNNSGAGGDAEAMPIINNTASSSMLSTYYTDLIAYIITRIRNQTHANTQINDTLLVEISKLTASAVQNFAPTLVNYKSLSATSPHISPKKFYMKIKKISVPRQRDEFLQWYQNYLENLFPGARLEAERRREEMRNNSGVAVAAAGVLSLQRMSNKMENHKQVQQQQKQQSASVNINKDNNDEDLAEADQNSANSSSNTIDMMLDGIFDGACAQPQQQQQPASKKKHASASVLMRANELENNENPDDNDNINTNARVRAAPHANAKCMDIVNGVGDVAADTSSSHVPLDASVSSAARTVAAITDDAISAAMQQYDLLSNTTDAVATSSSATSPISHT